MSYVWTPITQFVSYVKANDVIEMRNNIDDVRSKVNLPVFGWSPVIVAGSKTIDNHLPGRLDWSELRTALDEGYDANVCNTDNATYDNAIHGAQDTAIDGGDNTTVQGSDKSSDNPVFDSSYFATHDAGVNNGVDSSQDVADDASFNNNNNSGVQNNVDVGDNNGEDTGYHGSYDSGHDTGNRVTENGSYDGSV